MGRSLKRIETTLHHEVVPPQAGRDPRPTLVLLHGLGTNESDLLPLAAELGRDDVLVVGARAPHAYPAGSGLGYAWYDFQAPGEALARSVGAAVGVLEPFLEDVIAGYPVDPQRLFVLGFSQGAVMALAVSLRRPDLVAGVIALSGYLPPDSKPARVDDGRRFPVFIGHGTDDPLIGVQAARDAADALQTRGHEVSLHECPAAHSITAGELADVGSWLNTQIAAKSEDGAPDRNEDGG